MSHREIRVEDIEREAIEAARARPPTERLLDGLRLFDRTCQIMTSGIRHERPDVDAHETMRILRERLPFARQLERDDFETAGLTIIDPFSR